MDGALQYTRRRGFGEAGRVEEGSPKMNGLPSGIAYCLILMETPEAANENFNP